MKIVTGKISAAELRHMAAEMFGDMVKAVVDVNRRILAVDGELHADLEALLLENGSSQKDLWGINLYPEMQGDEFVEFDSMINVRPSQGNKTRGISSEEVRRQVMQIVGEKVER